MGVGPGTRTKTNSAWCSYLRGPVQGAFQCKIFGFRVQGLGFRSKGLEYMLAS